MEHPPAIRLDKWLWAARFFKTRALASKAIKGGKVHCNGERIKPKPARTMHLGDTLEIQQGYDKKTVQVQNVSDRRGPATEAAKLYQETKESFLQREQNKEQSQSAAASNRPHGQGRPSKRERRHIIRFIRADD